jgi:phosphate-selective porin OprO/OprP
MLRRPSVLVVPIVLAAVLSGTSARAAAQAPSPAPAPASETAPQATQAAPPDAQTAPQTPEERIEALDQQLRILARQIEIEKEAAAAAQATAPVAVAGANGFELRSADSAFRLRIRGYLHADSRYYGGDDDNRGIDTFLLRRARPIVEATFFKIFDFRIMTDFGGGVAVVQDAYFDARFAKVFNLRAGKQKPPLGQERLLSATDILFIERALPTALVPNRDVGVQVYGDPLPWLTYQVGVFNGVIDGGSGDVDTADSKDVVGRLLFSPFKANANSRLQSLSIGIGGSAGKETGTVAAPALAQLRSGGQLVWFRYRSDGTAPNTTVADGSRTRFTTHGQYYLGQLGLQAEYVVSRQEVRRATTADEIEQQSWQVTGSWVLTGEAATGRVIAPRKPFAPGKGAWGAFEIVARANALTVDDAAFPVFANPDASAREATAAGVGLNWYLNRNVKIAADYELTRFDRGALAGADRPDEHALFTRFQIAF